jgi:DNA-binding LacI/PurR family transcriptional regulator
LLIYESAFKRFIMAVTHNRPPTIEDVAQRAEVSIATVSRVVNGSTPVNPQTAKRVREAIRELNYVPSPAARTLANRRTNTIGLLLPEISGAFFPPMLRGIEAGVRAEGYGLLIHSTSDVHRRGGRALAEHNTDGLLIFPESIEESEVLRLHSRNFPIVLLHQTPPSDLRIPTVTIENQAGAGMLVSHLIEKHGRRRIAFLRGPAGHEDSMWRERGYKTALHSHGIGFDEDLVGEGRFDETTSREVVQSWLLDGLDFDAVFAGDDDSAIGAVSALRNAGKRVPEDVAVVGFDDVPFARFLSPPLTTIRAPIEAVGREAVGLLMKSIRQKHCETTLRLPTELVIRQSCGCT